ncbi:MAG: hypothetical protein ACJ8LG_00360 [Massilia sp.]
MANIGANNRRSLTGALKRFASMLIEEARDVGGFTFAELDALLDFDDGTTSRYSQRKRAPNAEDIQDLENKVARLLKRPAHLVVIENNGLAAEGGMANLEFGVPDKALNLRDTPANSLQLGYDTDWPTYRRLKYSPPSGSLSLLSVYAWQWGILWDRGALGAPSTREASGLHPDTPVEVFLPGLVEDAKVERAAYMRMRRSLNVGI